MSRTHESLVKPLSTNDQVYAWTRERIRGDREQLRRWTLFEIVPGIEPLSKLVKDYQDLHAAAPDEFGLLEVPENISYANVQSDERAKRFLLSDVTYSGTTVADLFEAVAKVNRCLSVNVSPDRRQVAITISDSTSTCPSGGLVCQGIPCRALIAAGR
jgi:hypothetical protein